jgi:uncharacterized protein (DUF2336 family)
MLRLEVIRSLSRHDEITVAGPVLTHSKRLSEHDLIDVAKSKSQAHLFAISGRASISETVTDILVERGDLKVHNGLARNSGARFSEPGFRALVRNSENDEALAENSVCGSTSRAQLLRQLLSRATELVRSRLLAGFAGHLEKIQGALTSIASEIDRQAAGPRDFKRADSLVLSSIGAQLNEAALVGLSGNVNTKK